MTPISFIPLDDIEAVDLTRHALIEASAGTGKTYTIENLVVRLLKTEPDLALENILLVTFTEKAVSELKLRIRQRIEAELVSEKTLPADVHKKLEACLDNFDTAAIFTIHGFCYTLLREFPFETGSLFEQEPVDDGPLMEKWLRRQIRDQWPQRYGRHLDILLHVSGFSAGPENFIRTIIKIARQLTGDPAEERIVPASPDQDAASLWQSILSAVSALTSLMGDPNADLADQYNHLNIHASTRKSIISKVIVPVQAALADILPEEDPSIDAVSCLNDVLEAASDRLSSLVPEKWLKAGENLSVCPNLHAIQDHLVHLHQTFLLLSHLLQQDAINTLRADVEAEKAANGWISYQDMLSRVAAFVQKSDAGAGIDAIRNRYRIAFVDEFQDTDSVQWRIFKTLFLEGGNTRFGNRLFLIGDPKQAIYGFRGADVFTYLSARQEMIRLADRGEASLYSLSTNWRSLPDLVTAFNFLFSTPAWFGPGPPADPFAIGYMTAASPPPDMLPMTLAGDPASSLPLVVADLSDHPDTSAARTALASFICQEIRHLVEASDVHIADTNGKTRKPTFGDMAILVRTQNEFLRLEPALCAWNIPFAYYRQPGLFQSVQAHFLSMVLRAISRPQDPRLLKTALLTPFFDIPPPSLVNLADIPADHPIRRLMRHWVYLAARRNWGALFQSLMADSGLCLRHCLDPDWERMETNFQQIFDHLMVSAHIKNLDLGGMAALLDRLREDDANPDPDADIHQIADEGDKVRILTLHVSKGLEFPIVFVAGGLSVKGPEKIRVYHEKNPDPAVSGFRKIIDLSGAINPEAADKESADEDRRLFYVALTRARLRLYLPWYPKTTNHRSNGPLRTFVAQSVDEAKDAMALACVMDWRSVGKAVFPPLFVLAQQKSAVCPDFTGPFLPDDTDYSYRKLNLTSFSGLSRELGRFSGGREGEGAFHLSGLLRREDDEPVFSTLPDLDEAVAELPGGARMGSLFHYIFENIDFDIVMTGPEAILDHGPHAILVDEALARFRIDPKWRVQIAERVAAVLRTPMDLDGETLILGHLSPDARQHEVEFFFPATRPGDFGDTVAQNTMIRGFIDLLIEWKGKFYIADWKSNRLADGYSQAAMAAEMAEAGYDLQYQIYTVAMLRWLKQVRGGGFDPNRHFGGALYFFIRGMKPGSQDGVFHVPPDLLLPLSRLDEKLYALLSGQRNRESQAKPERLS